MLRYITTGINFIGLITTIGVGVYLVLRRSRQTQAWLAALAAWSAGGYFLNYLLAINPPPAPPPEIKAWLDQLMLFWPRDVFDIGWKGWLLGWLPVYSIIFWYHTTLYVLPGASSRNRLWGAVPGYAVALAAILVKARYSDAWISLMRDPLYNPSLPLPFYPLFVGGFVTFAGLGLYNLARTARSSPVAMPRRLFWLFVYTFLPAGIAGLGGIAAAWLNSPIPQVFTSFFLISALLLGGFSFAIYLEDSRRLRFHMKEISGMLVEKEASEVLNIILETLACGIKATWAAILCESEQELKLLSSWNLKDVPLRELVASQEVSRLPADIPAILYPQQLSPAFNQSVVALALTNQEQRNLLLAGTLIERLDFSKGEQEMLKQVGDLMAKMDLNCTAASELPVPGMERSFQGRPGLPVQACDFSSHDVELALRNLHHYQYLADSPLARLRLVVDRFESLEKGADTHIDRGRAVSQVVSEAVSMLRPSQEEMPTPPPRPWYPFIILWDAYVENKPNLEIMSRLYISEGTFNRTRKAAIGSVTRLLMEMETYS